MTAMPNESPDLLTTAKRFSLRPKEAAQALGISERLLWIKTNCGEIPHCRIGLTATTSAHGSQSPVNTDWSPLAGTECVILPE